MVTSPYELKILEWDGKLQTNQTNIPLEKISLKWRRRVCTIDMSLSGCPDLIDPEVRTAVLNSIQCKPLLHSQVQVIIPI